MSDYAIATVLPVNTATESTLAAIKAKTDNLDVALSTRSKPADQQHVIIDSGTISGVTVNNAAGASAVNIQDGGNSLTIDGTVSISGTIPVSGPIALSAGSAVIGHVIADSGSTTVVTGNVTVVQGTATNLKVDASGVAVPVTDNAGSLTVDNNGTFAVQAAQSGTWTVQPGNTANSTAWKVDGSAVTQPVSGTLTGVTTVATVTSITNVVHVDDNAGSLTIDSAQLPAALVGGRIDSNAGAWLGSTAPTVGSKTSANSVPVVVASDQGSIAVAATLQAGSALVGHVIADSGSTTAVTGNVTAIQGTGTNLHTVVDSGTITTVTTVTGATISNAAGASAVNVQDGGNSLTVDGTVTDGGAGKTLKSASFSLAATGTVVSAVGGKRLKVYACKLVVSAAISVNWRDGASTAFEGAQPIAANGGFVENVNPPAFLFGTTAGNTLDLVISGSGTASGRVSYWDDDAV